MSMRPGAILLVRGDAHVSRDAMLMGAGFMEVWYSTINHPDTGGGVWLRYTITSPRSAEPYCELWGFYFDPENKRTFAGKQRFDCFDFLHVLELARRHRPTR